MSWLDPFNGPLTVSRDDIHRVKVSSFAFSNPVTVSNDPHIYATLARVEPSTVGLSRDVKDDLIEFFWNGDASLKRKAELLLPLLEDTRRNQQLMATICKWDMFSYLARNISREVMLRLVRSAGGYEMAETRLMDEVNNFKGKFGEIRQLKQLHEDMGEFLSTAGRFEGARKHLVRARDLAGKIYENMGSEVGKVSLSMARNEIRYWDARRDWKTLEELSLLLQSSATACDTLRVDGDAPVRGKLRFGLALGCHANACFKAGCVPGEGQLVFLDRADACVKECVDMLHHLGNTFVLAMAILVGGVTSLVRANIPDIIHGGVHAQDEHISHSLEAMDAFYCAEEMLCAVVGSSTELSIFTHGNLGETYISVFREINVGLFHMEQACRVAFTVFGMNHPNTVAKVKELLHILDVIGVLNDELQQRITNGNVDGVHTIRRFRSGPFRNVLVQRKLVQEAQRLGCGANVQWGSVLFAPPA